MDHPSNCQVATEEAWTEIANTIRFMCFQIGMPQGAADWICEDMKPRCLPCLGSIDLHGLPKNEIALATIDRVGTPFKERAARWVGELIRIEFELYMAKFLAREPDAPEIKEKIRRAFTVIEGGKSD